MNVVMFATVFLIGFFAGMVGTVTAYLAGRAWEARKERKRGYTIDVYEPEPLTPVKH